MDRKFKVVLVDDHVLLRNGLASTIDGYDRFKVMFEASNGKEFIQLLNPGNLPDMVILDISMPEMDGYSTASWIKRNYPDIKTLAFSMFDTENAIIRMLKAGVRGYILKQCDPPELHAAMESLIVKGYYYSEHVTGRIIHTINQNEDHESDDLHNPLHLLNDRLIEFLRYSCSEMTYKEIASKMYLSPRTIDGYRDILFEKLNIRTRIGLVTFAIKYGIYTP